VLDLARATAQKIGADLVVANDPDADRLAVVVPGPDGWHTLSGDELGALLGNAVLTRLNEGRPIEDLKVGFRSWRPRWRRVRCCGAWPRPPGPVCHHPHRVQVDRPSCRS